MKGSGTDGRTAWRPTSLPVPKEFYLDLLQ